MKTFLIIRDGFDLDTEANIGSGTRVTGHTSLENIVGNDFWDRTPQQLYVKVDKESVADLLLKELAAKTPGTSWSKYKLCGSAKAKPGPVEVTAVTEQGVLPV